MALFQKPPQTAEEAARYAPLDILPEHVQDLTEEEWYDKVYRGEDSPQLTVRALLMGSALGFILAFSNLYIGLKTGWALGVAITACIMSYGIWTAFLRWGVAKTPMTVLENNCMQSTASAAGYSTGGTMVSAISAMMLLSVTDENPVGEHLGVVVLVLWTIFLAALGTLMAIPMKRTMINRERLKFPSGTAAAVTLQSLYSTGSTALTKARTLGWSAIIGGGISILVEWPMVFVKTITNEAKGTLQDVRDTVLPYTLRVFDFFGAPGSKVIEGETVTNRPSDWTMTFDVNPVMIAAGGLVGMRVAFYMLVGGLILVFGMGGPALVDEWTSPIGEQYAVIIESAEGGATIAVIEDQLDLMVVDYAGLQDTVDGLRAKNLADGAAYAEALAPLAAKQTFAAVKSPSSAWKEVGLWLGVSIMLSYGLLSFFAGWRTILRALSGVGKKASGMTDLQKATEVPTSWFAWGVLFAGSGTIWVAHSQFDIPLYLGALAVFMTYFLALVAARATGESDITPVGAMGKIMQLTFGTLIPTSMTANLMSASITSNAAGSSADLLNDLKSGYLLGANPRRQFAAQAMGILAGTAATVTGFYLLVPDASVMTGIAADGSAVVAKYPAPAARAWEAVARVMVLGVDSMHPRHLLMVQWGLVIGAAILAMEKFVPKKSHAWLPSATGLGLGLILPFNYPLSMFLGAVIAWAWTKKRAENADLYMIPIIAGLIAGLSIFGVIGALLGGTVWNTDPVPIG